MSVIKTSLKRTPFNLPPPWSSKMAVPQNVVDEGLERRTFVTQWAPRGTFDNPAVGTGGYVVPDYVLKERYGRGTYVTQWAPRGSYFGPGLPNWLNYPTSALASAMRTGGGHVEYVMDSLHGDEPVASSTGGGLPGPIEAYGQQAASAVLRHAASYPPTKRKAALKNVMDKVDPSLWSRSAKIAKRFEAQGMPSAMALHQGIARAFGTGMIAELVKTGQTGKAPPPRGQLGLGCYAHSYARPSALGDTAAPKALTTTPSAGVALAQQAVSSTTAACGNPAPGFSWAPATATVAGHWERQKAGVTPTPYPIDGCYTINSRMPTTQVVTKPDLKGGAAPARLLQVGPFQIDATPGVHILGATVRDNRTGASVPSSPWSVITPEWRTKIGNEIVKQWQLLFANRKISQEAPILVPASELGITVPPLFSVVPGGISQADLTNNVINPMQKGPSTREQLGQPNWVPLYLFPTRLPASGIPLWKATHPDTGELYGLWLYPGGSIQGGGASNVNGEPSLRKDADGYHMAGPVRIFWGPIHSPTSNWLDTAFGAFTDFIGDIGAFIVDAVDAVGTALKDIADAACSLLSSPAAGQAAAVGAIAAGAPPAAGAGGAALAQKATGCGPAGPTPPQTVQQPSYLLPLAIGVVAVGALIVLTTPKSQKTKKGP